MDIQRTVTTTAYRTSREWGLLELLWDTDLEQYFLGDLVTPGGIVVGGSGSGVSAHSALTGLAADDHLQYHTDDRAATWLETAGALIVSIIDDALAGSGWQSGGGVTDHGLLTGLLDDDHPDYFTQGRANTWLATKNLDAIPDSATRLALTTAERAQLAAIPTPPFDHGALTGLGDDDHTQYHTQARANTWLATKNLDAIVDSATRLAMTTAERAQLAALPAPPFDHGALTGLSDDDHAQYHTSGRADTWLATKNLDAVIDSATRLAMTSAERTKLTSVAMNANNYVHPNHTGDVTSLADGAQTIAANAVTTAKILDANVTLAKLANLAADLIIGRANGAGTGVPVGLTATQVRTIINVENGATADMTAQEIILALGTGITTVRTTNVTGLVNGNIVLCNSLGGSFTVAPPPSVVGNRFTVIDATGASAANPITVTFGAALLNSTNQSYLFNHPGSSAEFLYCSVAIGWTKLG